MCLLDVKTDYAFRRVLGTEGSKPLSISFLNAILEFIELPRFTVALEALTRIMEASVILTYCR